MRKIRWKNHKNEFKRVNNNHSSKYSIRYAICHILRTKNSIQWICCIENKNSQRLQCSNWFYVLPTRGPQHLSERTNRIRIFDESESLKKKKKQPNNNNNKYQRQSQPTWKIKNHWHGNKKPPSKRCRNNNQGSIVIHQSIYSNGRHFLAIVVLVDVATADAVRCFFCFCCYCLLLLLLFAFGWHYHEKQSENMLWTYKFH